MDDSQLLHFQIMHQMKSGGTDPAAPISISSFMAGVQTLITANAALAKRIAALETTIAGQQKKLDHLDSHALTFRGEWLPSERYYPGSVVRHGGGVYTALCDLTPGKSEPGRQGSHWDQLI